MLLHFEQRESFLGIPLLREIEALQFAREDRDMIQTRY